MKKVRTVVNVAHRAVHVAILVVGVRGPIAPVRVPVLPTPLKARKKRVATAALDIASERVVAPAPGATGLNGATA